MFALSQNAARPGGGSVSDLQKQALKFATRAINRKESSSLMDCFRRWRRKLERGDNLSLYLFPIESWPRQLAISILASRFFDRFILASIIANCVLLTLYDYGNDDNPQNQELAKANYLFAAIFSTEMIIKSIASGLFVNRTSLLRSSGWNRLDFILVLSALLDIAQIPNTSALKCLRLLRPLRAVSMIKEMRVILASIMSSLHDLANVAILFSFFLLLMSIISVQLFQGALRQVCVDDITGNIANPSQRCSIGTGGYECGAGTTCLPNGENPQFGITSFDNVPSAMVLNFQIISYDNYSSLLYLLWDAHSPYVHFFFVIMIMIGSFFMISLFLIIVNDSFDRAVRFERERAKKLDDEHKLIAAAEAQKSRNSLGVAAATFSTSGVTSSIYLASSKASMRHDLMSISKFGSKIGSTMLSRSRSLASIKRAVGGSAYRLTQKVSESNWFQRLRKVLLVAVEHHWFSRFIVLVIIINSAFMSAQHYSYPPDESFESMLERANVAFNSIFLVELLMKLTAYGFQLYFKDVINCFDCFTVLLGFVDIILNAAEAGNLPNLTALRTLRLLRILKIARTWKSLRLLLSMLMRSLSSAAYLFLLLLLCVFIFALISAQFFAGKMGTTFSEPRLAFDTFPQAYLTVMVSLTGTSWSTVMYNTMHATSNYAVLIGIFQYMFFTYLMLNIFIAILMSSFDSTELQKASGGPNLWSKAARGFLRLRNVFTLRRHERKIHVAESHPSIQLSGNMQHKLHGWAIQAQRMVAERRAISEFLQQSSPSPAVAVVVVETRIAVAQSPPPIPSCEPLFHPRNQAPPPMSEVVDPPRPSSADPNHNHNVLSVSSSSSSSSSPRPLPPLPSSCTALFIPISSINSHQQREAQDPLSALPSPPSSGRRTRRAYAASPEPASCSPVRPLPPKASLPLLQTTRIPPSVPLASGAASSALSARILQLSSRLTTRFSEMDSLCGIPLKRNRSLGILDGKNPLRLFALKAISNPYFESFLQVMIAFSSITIALENPNDDPNGPMRSGLRVCELIQLSVFITEMALKIVALGLAYHEGAYLRSSWNLLDAFVVAVSVISELFDSSQFKALKMIKLLRALRPLKMIRNNPGMRLIVDCILSTLPAICDVVLVALLIMLILGIAGVGLLAGKFGSCSDPVVLVRSACIGSYYDPVTQSAVDRIWSIAPANFDNIGSALLTLFRMITQDNWSDVLYSALDANDVDHAPVMNNSPFYGLFIVLCCFIMSYIILNLFIGVLLDTYFEKRNNSGPVFATEGQNKRWRNVLRTILGFNPRNVHPDPPTQPWRLPFYQLSTDFRFEALVALVIAANTVFLCLDHYPSDTSFDTILLVANEIFTYFFVVEATVKLTAFGVKGYFSDSWCRFDFFVATLSVLGLYVSIGFGATVFRVLRATRTIRLVRHARGVQKLLRTLFLSLPALANTSSLLFLIMFIYAALGVQIFAKVKYPGPYDGLDQYCNFSSFSYAFAVLFRVLTADSWVLLMYDTSVLPPQCSGTYENPGDDCGNPVLSVIYFCSFIIIASFTMLQLFIAVVMEAFADESEKEDSTGITEFDLDRFSTIWYRFDTRRTHYMPIMSIGRVIRLLGTPFAPRHLLTNAAQMIRFLNDLHVPQHKSEIHYKDLLLKLIEKSLGDGTNMPLEIAEQLDKHLIKVLRAPVRGVSEPAALSELYSVIRIQTLFRNFLARKRAREEAAAIAAAQAGPLGEAEPCEDLCLLSSPLPPPHPEDSPPSHILLPGALPEPSLSEDVQPETINSGNRVKFA